MKTRYSESIQKSLLQILKEAEKEDEYVYQRLIREAKLHELYWNGFQ